MKQPLETVGAPPEQPARPMHGADRAVDLRSPYFSTAEACDYLRFTGKHRLDSLYRFLKRQGVRTARAGRKVLVVKADLRRVIGEARKAS